MNKEQIEDLANYIWEGGLHLADIKGSIDYWFEQNPQEPVVVGLSDEQADSFLTFWHEQDSCNYIDVYKDWAKTQTFAQPQQLTPNWDDAPADANFITIDNDGMRAWHKLKPEFDIVHGTWGSDGSNGIIFNDNSQKLFKRPTQPTPKVEVGQVWTNIKTGKSYVIYCLTKTKITNEWIESVSYQLGEEIYTRKLEDFLAKFTLVSK